MEAIHWVNIFAKIGSSLQVKNLGCCGMAGTYGHQKEHQHNSEGLFDMNWRSHIVENVLATGFSCRCQSKRFANITIAHPIEILATSFA